MGNWLSDEPMIQLEVSGLPPHHEIQMEKRDLRLGLLINYQDLINDETSIKTPLWVLNSMGTKAPVLGLLPELTHYTCSSVHSSVSFIINCGSKLKGYP